VTKCGKDSTLITAPFLIDLSQPPNKPALPTFSDSFMSSNPTCPIEMHTISSGDASYVLTDDQTSFIVTLSDEANAIDFQNGEIVDAVFPFTIMATAKGGGIAETSA
jgi:hypothetical protein